MRKRKEEETETERPRFYLRAFGADFQKILDDKHSVGLVPVVQYHPNNYDLKIIRWLPIKETRLTGGQITIRGCTIDERE